MPDSDLRDFLKDPVLIALSGCCSACYSDGQGNEKKYELIEGLCGMLFSPYKITNNKKKIIRELMSACRNCDRSSSKYTESLEALYKNF